MAQTRDTGTLGGRVVDPSGAVVVGAAVQAWNSATGISHGTFTNHEGRFVFVGLPLTGAYTVTVESSGFARFQASQIQLWAGRAIGVNVRLAISGSSTMTVTESVTSDASGGETRLDSRHIDNTPDLGRKINVLALLDSAVRPARGTGDIYLGDTLFVVDAGGRRQTTFSLDNSTADDSWGRQTLFTHIPLSAVQELTVLTNAGSAEYGRTSGSALNLVTKSGTNNYHGDLIGLWRPGALEANLPLSSSSTADKLEQGSGSFSGPIQTNRTYFMGAAEYSAENRDSAISSVLGPGVYEGEYRQTMALVRLDHQWNAHDALMARLNLDRFSDSNPSDTVGALTLPSAARIYRRRTYSGQLSETTAFSPRLLNEARLEVQVASPITQFEPVTPSTQFVRAGVGTEGESRSASLRNHQYQFADTVLYSRGRHSLKAGGDIIYSTSGGFGQEFGGGYVLGQFTVNPQSPNFLAPLSQLTIADMSHYTQTFGNQSYTVQEWLLAGFVQDDIALTSHLMLNLGLRYEVQTFTDSRKDVAPRLGFAYQMPFQRSTVLRGSYNIFYSELPANLAAGWEINGPQGLVTFSATPGQLGFPTSLAPLPAFPAGAVLPPRDIMVRPGESAYLNQFLDVSKLRFYPDALLNPYTQQWSLGLERELAANWILSLDYTGQHTIRIDQPVDLNAPAPFVRTAPGQVRSAAAADLTRPIVPVPNGFRQVIATVSEGAAYYEGLEVNLKKRFSRHFSALLSYTWSHTMNTVEPDAPSQDPNDFNYLGRAELASSLLDQRHRAALSGWYELPRRFVVGSFTTLASGRPFSVTTGVDNNGDGFFSDRPVVNGVVVPRNWGRGTPSYDISAFAEKVFQISERWSASLRAEGFNLLNHSNIVGRNGVWGNGATPATGFGQGLPGVNNVDISREFQFQFRLRF